MMFWSRRKSRETKENDTTRGNYSPVVVPHNGLKHRPIVRRKVAKLAPMVALLLGAATLMIIHHIFNSRLNEKRIDPGSTELPSLLQSQRNVNIIGTTIAHGARILLAMAIGATFSQMFWETLRSRSFTVAQVDALVRCRQSPFHPSAHRAATASLALFIVSLAASATALVVVLSPGSLTINSEFQRTKSCTVPTVPPKVTASDYEFPFGDTDAHTNVFAVIRNIMTSNSYLPPFRANFSSPCGDEVTSCSYNVTSVGPALDCIDITSETNFTAFTPTGDPPNQVFWIWDTTRYNGSAVGVTILSRDLEKGLLQANNCSAYNATYDVGVNSNKGSATLEVWDVTLGPALSWDDNNFLTFLGSNAILSLPVPCQAGPDVRNCGVLGYPFFVTTPTGNLTFGDTVPHFVTSLVQNITLSLLSGSIYYGYSNDTATNLEYVQSTCSSIVAIYVYNSKRLLATYVFAMAVSTMVIVYGCYLILCNDVERDFLLSHLAGVALNEEMLSLSGDSKNHVYRKAQMQLFRTDCTRQKLVLVSRKRKGPTPVPMQSGVLLSSTRGKYLTAPRSEMLLLVLSAVGCMILNHAYYHYLDGKEPNSSLHLPISSGWVLNQTVASDVGIALAYAGQTLLAVAIGTSCAQLFWHAMRHRGHTIHEVDALMKAQNSPFSLSLFVALKSSMGVSLLAFLAVSTTLISILAPGSIKVASDHNQRQNCTVLAPRNISALAINSTLDEILGSNVEVVSLVASLGTYLAPINVCGSGPSTEYCSYDLEFVGPGFDCEDVTESSNYTAFATLSGPNITTLYYGEHSPFNSTDPWQIFIQTWDVKRSVYQANKCTGVLRSYSVSISHTTVSTLNVSESRLVSLGHGNISPPVSFAENYLLIIMAATEDSGLQPVAGSVGGIGTIQLDGDITWSQNMSRALEDFAQNATLSLLSGQVATFVSDVPDVLENVTTTCTYTFTAYEYSPRRLFLTYGVGILVTILCALWGLIAIRQNGVEESMNFSRLLRAILNEKMYNARETLDKDTVVKADETAGGSIAPMDS